MTLFYLIFTMFSIGLGAAAFFLYFVIFFKSRSRVVAYFLVMQIMFLVHIGHDAISNLLTGSGSQIPFAVAVFSYVLIISISAMIGYSMTGFYLTLAGIPFVGRIRLLYASGAGVMVLSSLSALTAPSREQVICILNIILTIIVTIPLFLNYLALNTILVIRLRRTEDRIMKALIRVTAVFSFMIFVLFGGWFVLDVFFSLDFTGGQPSMYEIMFTAWNLIAVVLFLLYTKSRMQESTGPDLQELPQKGVTALARTFSRYEKSSLERTQAEAHLNRLLNVMKTVRPYRDPALTLDRLARLCGTSRNHLSQVLNQYRDTTFYNLINTYRIADAKKMLSDPACRMSILEIAFESGFNSKTAFYTAFSKLESIDPTEFRKQFSSPVPERK
ncbi:MAG: helix-turn-helix transcriptional regulator [Spirochaetales bacterium]|nr:helix-turn-helix transcriptional regulator [Spirochaetales bacterium]